MKDREDEVAYIAMISFGKDSSVMVDLLCKEKEPLDYILFTDTLMENPLMYQYAEKFINYINSRYKKQIKILKPLTTFEEWCFGVIRDKKAENYGKIRGIPMVWAEPCYWKREAKAKVANRFLKENNIKKSVVYIGYTYGENRNINDEENIKYKFPLVDRKIKETNCQEYLSIQDMENPIYKFFSRSGCETCTGKSDKAWFTTWKYFKDVWEYMRLIQNRLLEYQSMGMEVKNPYWFVNYRTIEDMEKLFKEKDKQGSLFDFSDEPVKDCFCKI